MPAMFIILGYPIIFGWAKPVPINPMNFRDLRKGTFLVSIAGVAMNIALAVFFGAVYRTLDMLRAGVDTFLSESIIVPLLIFSAKAVLINLVLALFNIIPIPPLDGSRALMSFLSFKYWELFYKYEMYGFLAITVLLFTGILGKIIYPPLVILYNLILGRI
jgi:Zn-dependent protease